MLGLTFKENVPDLRNTKVADLVAGLTARGHEIAVADPIADPVQAKALYGLELATTVNGGAPYDGVVGAVTHDAYRTLTADDFATLVRPGGLIADIKGMWRDIVLPDGLRRWQL